MNDYMMQVSKKNNYHGVLNIIHIKTVNIV